jgi:hypothetical protein
MWNESSGFVFNSNNSSTNIHDLHDHDDNSFCSNVRSELSLINTYDLEVFNAICQIKSNAIGMDGFPVSK